MRVVDFSDGFTSASAPTASAISGTTGTFTDSVTITTANVGLKIVGVGGSGNRIHLFEPAASGRYNWQIDQGYTTSNVISILPSTAADGSTFSNAVVKLNRTGAVTIGNATLSSVTSVLGGVASTDSTTGTLVITGGLGVSGAGYFGGALSTSGLLTVTTTGNHYIVANAATSNYLLIKGASGNSSGLKIGLNNTTDVASIINFYSGALEFGTNNIVRGSINSAGLWTIGAASSNNIHVINGLLSATATSTDQIVNLIGNPGSVVRFNHQAASGEYNFQVGRWNAANTWGITPSTATDGSSFDTDIFRATAAGLITIGASGGTQVHVINGNCAIQNAGELRLHEGSSGAEYTGFKAPASLSANCIYTLPSADGSANQVISTNGSKVLSWASVATAVGTESVVGDTPTGHGSTGTKVRTWTSGNVTTTGTDMTYTSDTTNGDYITINSPGVYSIMYTDSRAAGSGNMGISLNAGGATTTDVSSLTAAQRLCAVNTHTANGLAVAAVTVVLASTNTIRFHTNANCDNATATAQFRITKVAD
jgi:hypothetical protein